jgi:hypothetical protein
MSDGVTPWFTCPFVCSFVRPRCVSVRPRCVLGASSCVFVRLCASLCVSVRLRASPCVSVRPISPNWGKRGFLHALKPRHSVNYPRLKKTLLRTKVANFPKQPGSTQPSSYPKLVLVPLFTDSQIMIIFSKNRQNSVFGDWC